MKEKLHPKYEMTKISCACGNVIETRSTVRDLKVEICSACHPFFTGKQKLVDRMKKSRNNEAFLKSMNTGSAAME